MDLQHAILTILSGGPKHGYAVRRELSHVLAGIRTVNQGQVYATLERLARDGLVAASAAGPPRSRRIFALTAAGRRSLQRWLERPVAVRQPRSELPARLALLASLGNRTGIARLLAEQRARCSTAARLAGRRAEVARGDGMPRDLVARALLRHVEAELDWLDLVERELVARAACRGAAVFD